LTLLTLEGAKLLSRSSEQVPCRSSLRCRWARDRV